MTYRGPMARSVASSLASVTINKEDEGAAALARRYAALIDDAQPSAIYARHLDAVRRALDTLTAAGLVVGVDYQKHFDKITEALAAHSAASDLGPKLLAALTALGLTVAGRPAKGGVPNDAGTPPAPESELDKLRRERAERAGKRNA